MIRVSIVGITGYTGEELLKILSKHPHASICGLYGRNSSAARDLKDVYPHFAGLNLKVEALDINKIKDGSDVVFLALPHAVAFEIVPKLADAGIKVIDLSADFRINDAVVYEKWYKVAHTAKDYIAKAVYGLSELNEARIKNASIVANPGCYPTSILLGCAPAVKNGFVDLKGMIVDAKSGISGAGRKASQEYFANEHPNFRAYKIAGSHRHIPEIEQELAKLSGENITLIFTPHIIPVERGMLSTIYVRLKKDTKTTEIIGAYKKFYEGKPFVKIFDEGKMPGIKDVENTNLCEISLKIDERTGTLIIISVIDNLVKGASGQAVQNMNIMFNLSETEGLV
ncbi:MAG: N-acetyl-gamma-glutamyl-phosphate reductase [Endomicrobium sp.]|jgi:N-acetyl-gamma-glutamyl-phosphate reductase|nr:N-acetyl-gamma-glutamyl-phosphate reductase [Endomicrobium sp.]